MFASDRFKRVACSAAVAFVGLMLTMSSVHAQSAAEREQEQVKRLKLQMRQLQQDQLAQQEAQAKLEQERSKAEQALKGLQSEVSGHQQAASANARRASILAAEVAALKKERDSLQAQVQQVTQQMNEAQQFAQRQQEDLQRSSKQQALQAAKEHEVRLDQCRAQNAQMYLVGADILTQYEQKGVREALGAHDPFLQHARVKLENFKAEYQDKLNAARIKTTPAVAASAP